MINAATSGHDSDPSYTGYDVTELLDRWSEGDVSAFDQLVPLIYDRMRAIAHHLFSSERRGHTLESTDLLHDVLIELRRNQNLQFESRAQFYSLAACLMRRALVDYSRRHCAVKRGGDQRRVSMVEALSQAAPRPEAFVALDDALQSLEAIDPQKARLVELKYFVGLSVNEISRCLGLSPRTTARQWEASRVLLYHLITTGISDDFR